VQVADELLLVNEERFQQADEWSAGLVVYDVSDPPAARRIGRYDCRGQGVHRLDGNTAYLGYGDAGLVVLDVSDLTTRKLARLDWTPGGGTHTCLPLPGGGLVVVTDEPLRGGPDAEPRYLRIVDVAGEPREQTDLRRNAIGAVRRGCRRSVVQCSVGLARELSEAANEGAVGDMGGDVRERGLRPVVEHQDAGRFEQRG
jgi:hypothetical protein